MSEEMQGESVNVFKFDAEKAYAIHYGHNGFIVGKHLETVRAGKNYMLYFKNTAKGWGSQKKHMINSAFITHVIEFDSAEQYEKELSEWENKSKRVGL